VSRRRRVTTSDGLRVERGEHVVWLHLERPQHGNRITLALAQALCAASAEIELDDDVHAVVLAASGGAFCLGIEDGGEWEWQADCIGAIGTLTRPVVAVLPGDALAEGLELALACDLRIASERASFAMPQVVRGHLPGHGGTQRLPRLVGRSRALELLLTGRRVTAAEALAIGLVSRCVPAAELTAAATETVTALAGKGPTALRFAKEAVLKGSDLTLDQGIRLEQDLYVLLQSTRDRREGIRAFLTKRRPRFRGE